MEVVSRHARLFLRKCKGAGEKPAPAAVGPAVASLVGGTLAILWLVWLTRMSGHSLLIAPFGATTVLLFAAKDSPLAQPRNVIGGHLVATAIALAMLSVFGPSLWAMGVAVGVSIGVMQLTRTTHPPAGADPILVFLAPPAWHFLWSPVLVGAVALVALALIFNNLNSSRGQRWPRWWL
ncbi:MAG TPA: HPP family protein [Planctomycetota bacterium]|nr:HPP family protein [Planctomycetota bacterium]